MSYIYHFDHPQAADANIAGGKGANLARMTMAGFPCPPALRSARRPIARLSATWH